MVHFLVKSVLPARKRVNGTDRLLLLRVIDLTSFKVAGAA